MVSQRAVDTAVLGRVGHSCGAKPVVASWIRAVMDDRRAGQVTLYVSGDPRQSFAQIGRILEPDLRDRLPVRLDAANGDGVGCERLRLDLKPQIERRAPGGAELFLERSARPISKRLSNDLAENQVPISFTGVVRHRRTPD